MNGNCCLKPRSVILHFESRTPPPPPQCPPRSTPQFLRGGEGGVKIIAHFSLTVPRQFVDGFHGRITVGAGK